MIGIRINNALIRGFSRKEFFSSEIWVIIALTTVAGRRERPEMALPWPQTSSNGVCVFGFPWISCQKICLY